MSEKAHKTLPWFGVPKLLPWTTSSSGRPWTVWADSSRFSWAW